MTLLIWAILLAKTKMLLTLVVRYFSTSKATSSVKKDQDLSVRRKDCTVCKG